jgi:hypothetical protein
VLGLMHQTMKSYAEQWLSRWRLSCDRGELQCMPTQEQPILTSNQCDTPEGDGQQPAAALHYFRAI